MEKAQEYNPQHHLVKLTALVQLSGVTDQQSLAGNQSSTCLRQNVPEIAQKRKARIPVRAQ